MFGKKRYQETEYDEAFEAVAPQEEEVHEEMPYLVEDGRTEIEGPFFDNL